MRLFSLQFWGLRCGWWSHLRQKLMKRKDWLPLTLTQLLFGTAGFCRLAHGNLILFFLLSAPELLIIPPVPHCSVPILTTIGTILLNKCKGSSSSHVSSKLELEFPLYVKSWTCAKASHLINSMALKCIGVLNVLEMIKVLRSRVRRCFLRRSLLSTHYLFNSTI